MVRTSLLIVLAVAAMAQSPIKPGRELANGVAVLESGVTVTYRMAVVLPVDNSPFRVYVPLGSAFAVSGNTMRHAIYDKTTQSYFGYDMDVTLAPGARSMQVSFGPLNASAMQDSLKAIAGHLPLNPARMPDYPAPQTVNDGDTIALDLMVGATGREKIVDYIQLAAPVNPRRHLAESAAKPRDFSIDDGPIQVPSEPPSVLIDGTPSGPVVMLTPRRGATFWFYFPGCGRYILSLAPHDGFVKAGTLRGREIAFQADGRQFEVRLSASPAGTPDAWNLYVLHDPAYLPGPPADLVVGGVDRLENLLPKQL